MVAKPVVMAVVMMALVMVVGLVVTSAAEDGMEAAA